MVGSALRSGCRSGNAASKAIYATTNAISIGHHEMLNEMRDTPATTLPGMAVRAAAVMDWLDPEGTGLSGPDIICDGRVAWSLARDILAMQAREAEASRELIELCARTNWLERGIQNGGGGLSLAEEKRRERAIEPLRKAQAPLLKQVVRMRATTLAGLRAKGATLALWVGEQLTPHGHSEGYWNVRMIRSVFCDLLGAPGVTRKAGAARMRQLQTGPSAKPEDVA